MKKVLILISYVLILSNLAFGQNKTNATSGQNKTEAEPEKNDSIKKMSERPLVFYLKPLFSAHEHGGCMIGLKFQNIKNALNFDRNFYIGIGTTLRSNFCAELGFMPLKKTKGKMNVYSNIGLGFWKRAPIYGPHDSLVSKTLGDDDRDIVTLKLGVNVEFGNRLGVFCYGLPGISWRETSSLNSSNNGFYYWGIEGGFYFLYGGLKKKKPEK